jgi:hypothetical protein
MTDFFSMVKSTLDKAGVDIATAYGQGTRFVDLDDQVAIQELLSSDDSAIVWELLTLVEDPRDPLYALEFGIGAKTTGDPGNYNMTELLDKVRDVISTGSSLTVYDFTPGGDGVTPHGYIFISSVGVDPQLQDKASGIRLIAVTGRAVSNG